jgi:membrane fusion protein, multidrug efflux system
MRNAQTRMGIVVPQSAVLQDREGRFVYVVDQGNAARQRRIETGPKLGDNWAVGQGLTAGERVVVQGTQRLSDGIIVQPVGPNGGSQP